MIRLSRRARQPGEPWAEGGAEAEAEPAAPQVLPPALSAPGPMPVPLAGPGSAPLSAVAAPPGPALSLLQPATPVHAAVPSAVPAAAPWVVPAPLAQPASGSEWRAAATPVAAASATPLAAASAQASLTVRVTAWPDLAALPGALVQAQAVPDAVAGTTAAGGLAVLSGVGAGQQVLQVSLAPTPAAQAQADAAVNLQDAVAVLRLLGGAPAASPWARKAADFDGNGAVTLADALGVLRHAVGQAAPRPGWAFFDAASGAGSASPAPAGGAGVPISTVALDVAAGSAPALVGVLRGDVDSSGSAGRFGLLAQADGGWAVKPGFGDVRLAAGAGDLVLSAAGGQAARLPLADAAAAGAGPLRLGGSRLSVDETAVDLAGLGAGAGLTGLGALVVGAELRLTLPQWQQALGGGVPLNGLGADAVMRLVVTTPQEAQALRQTLEDTAFTLGAEPVVAISVAVDAAHPQAASMAASIDATLREAAPALSAAVGRHVPVTLSTGELLPAPPPTLSVAVQGSVVSFGGTADSTLFVQVDSLGRATFTRASRHTAELASSDTVVTGLFSKTLAGVGAIAFTLGPSDAAVQYVLDAPQASMLVVSGSTGGGADEIVLRIADPRPGVYDGHTLHLDSAGLAAAGDTLTFRFAESARNVLSKPFDNDAVTLAASSHVNAGFSRLKVVAGIVDASLVGPEAGGYFPPQKEWEVSSGVVLSLVQLQATRGVVSPSASGALLVAVANDEQADLQALLAGPDAPHLAGVTAGTRVDGALSDELWSFPAAPASDIASGTEAWAQPLGWADAVRWGGSAAGGGGFIA
jgi:hypothetical protein